MQIDESQFQSEGIFREIVGNLRDGIIIIQDQKLAFCNPSFCALVGYQEEELLEGADGFLPPHFRELLESRFIDRIGGKPVPSVYEIEIAPKSGGIIPVELSMARIEYMGRPAVLGIVRDISMRKRHEQELVESEQRFRALIENVPVVIWVTAETGKTVYISPNVEQIYGYIAPEIIGGGNEFWFDRIFPDDREKVIRAFGQLFSSKLPFDMEYRIQRKDGAWIWLHDRAKLVLEKGTRACAYGVFSDITEQKQTEQQLHQVEKLQAIGQLAGGVAHDFNNQLAGILGYADLLRDEAKSNPEISRYADSIITAVKRAADLTSQLLAFSRKGKYLSVTVDIHRTILEVVSMLSHSIDKRITIEQELVANPSTTVGDPSQIHSAILNCALNARDAMPDGGVLKFSTRVVFLDDEFCRKIPYEIPSGRYLQIGIEDTGIGMDEETLPHIFEPFFSTKEKGKGTGMGLASAYGTIRNHKGAVHVTTTPGSGTTLRLFFPLSKAQEIQTVLDAPVALDNSNVHVLLVDDEKEIRAVASEMLEKLGFRVTCCQDGSEAVEFYRTNWKDIDLVILDMIMPKMGGEETFSELKKINPDLTVLVSSGYSFDGATRSVLDAGGAGFIQKPFGQHELAGKIAGILKKE